MLALRKGTIKQSLPFQMQQRAISFDKDFLNKLKEKPRLPQFVVSTCLPNFVFKGSFPYPYGYIRHISNKDFQEACREERKKNPFSLNLFCLTKILEYAHHDGYPIHSEVIHNIIKTTVFNLLREQSSDIEHPARGEAIATYKKLRNDYDLKGTRINLIPKEIRLPECKITHFLKDGNLTIEFPGNDLYPYTYLDLINHYELQMACHAEKAKKPLSMNLFILNNQLEQAHHDGKLIRSRDMDIIERAINDLLKNKSNNLKKLAVDEITDIAEELRKNCGIDPEELYNTPAQAYYDY